MSAMLDGGIPSGPIEQKWGRCRFEMMLVNPSNRRKHSIIVVGAGLAGAAASASLGQQGYHVRCFSFHEVGFRALSEGLDIPNDFPIWANSLSKVCTVPPGDT